MHINNTRIVFWPLVLIHAHYFCIYLFIFLFFYKISNVLFPPDAYAAVTCAFLQYENNIVCPEKDLKRASCEMLKIPSVSSPCSLCGLASPSSSRAVTKALRGHLCHQTRRVTEPLPWPRGWHTWQREMTTPLTYVCERLEAAFFVYSDEGVNRGRRKCPLLWGKSVHRALQSHMAHSRTTCYTHTHFWGQRRVLGLQWLQSVPSWIS